MQPLECVFAPLNKVEENKLVNYAKKELGFVSENTIKGLFLQLSK